MELDGSTIYLLSIMAFMLGIGLIAHLDNKRLDREAQKKKRLKEL